MDSIVIVHGTHKNGPICEKPHKTGFLDILRPGLESTKKSTKNRKSTK